MQRLIGDVCVLFAQNVEHGKRRGGVVHLMRARKRQRKRQAAPRERVPVSAVPFTFMFFSSGICRCAPRSLHADSMVSNTDGSCTGYSTTSPPFLMMPAFSNAIFA